MAVNTDILAGDFDWLVSRVGGVAFSLRVLRYAPTHKMISLLAYSQE